MASPRLERIFVRILVAIALCTALLACSQAPIPRDAKGGPALPAVALEQPGLYRLEIALLVFYGVLLLATPAFSGLIRGRLPTEISVRGAKFAGEADQSAELTEAAIKELRQLTKDLTAGLETATLEIERLEERSLSDSTQPGVD